MLGGSVARGDITYRGASAWERLGAGASGLFLNGRGASANPAWGPIAFGSGGMTLRASNTVAGSAATTLAVTGLDLNTDLRYWVEIEINSAGSSPGFNLTYNADTTAANYDCQLFESAGTGNAASRVNTSNIFNGLGTNLPCSFDGVIRINAEARPRMLYEYASGSAANVKRGHGVHTWRTASTNVTGLTLSCSVANGLEIGTSINVYC